MGNFKTEIKTNRDLLNQIVDYLNTHGIDNSLHKNQLDAYFGISMPNPAYTTRPDNTPLQSGDFFVDNVGVAHVYSGGTWHQSQAPVVDMSAIYTKTEIDTKLGIKADTSFVNTELGKKTDKTYVDTELAKKADKTEVAAVDAKFAETLADWQDDMIYHEADGKKYMVYKDEFGNVRQTIEVNATSIPGVGDLLTYNSNIGVLARLTNPDASFGGTAVATGTTSLTYQHPTDNTKKFSFILTQGQTYRISYDGTKLHLTTNGTLEVDGTSTASPVEVTATDYTVNGEMKALIQLPNGAFTEGVNTLKLDYTAHLQTYLKYFKQEIKELPTNDDLALKLNISDSTGTVKETIKYVNHSGKNWFEYIEASTGLPVFETEVVLTKTSGQKTTIEFKLPFQIKDRIGKGGESFTLTFGKVGAITYSNPANAAKNIEVSGTKGQQFTFTYKDVDHFEVSTNGTLRVDGTIQIPGNDGTSKALLSSNNYMQFGKMNIKNTFGIDEDVPSETVLGSISFKSHTDLAFDTSIRAIKALKDEINGVVRGVPAQAIPSASFPTAGGNTYLIYDETPLNDMVVNDVRVVDLGNGANVAGVTDNTPVSFGVHQIYLSQAGVQTHLKWGVVTNPQEFNIKDNYKTHYFEIKKISADTYEATKLIDKSTYAPTLAGADDLSWKTSKQNKLSPAQQAVVDGEVFTSAEKTKVDAIDQVYTQAEKTKLAGLTQTQETRLLHSDSTATKGIIKKGTFWRTETDTGINNPYIGIFGNDHYQAKLLWDGSNAALNWRDNTTTDSNLKLSDIATKTHSYTKAESDAKYLTSHQDISGKADKNLDNVSNADLIAKLTAAGVNVSIFNEFKGVLAADPTGTHNDLDWYINDTDYTIRVYHNSAWHNVGGSSGTLSKNAILQQLGLTDADITKLKNIESRLLNSQGDSHIKNSGGYHSESSFGGGAFIGVAKDNYAEMAGFKILSGKPNIRFKDDNGAMTDLPLNKINSTTMTVTFEDDSTATFKLGS